MDTTTWLARGSMPHAVCGTFFRLSREFLAVVRAAKLYLTIFGVSPADFTCCASAALVTVTVALPWLSQMPPVSVPMLADTVLACEIELACSCAMDCASGAAPADDNEAMTSNAAAEAVPASPTRVLRGAINILLIRT